MAESVLKTLNLKFDVIVAEIDHKHIFFIHSYILYINT